MNPDILRRFALKLWDICAFRAGPQDLPASSSFLLMAIAAYWLVGVMGLAIQMPLPSALLQAAVDLALLSGLAWLGLRVRNHTARFTQTMTALAGTGALIGLVAWPVVLWMTQVAAAGQGGGLATLVFLLVLGWSLAVTAIIVQAAMAIPRGMAIAFTVGYLVLSVYVTSVVLASSG
jgi:hypothetical protein